MVRFVILLLLLAPASMAMATDYRVKLYFGLSTPDGGVSLADWQAFETDVLAKTFAGFTVADSRGYYKGRVERSKVVTVLTTEKEFPRIDGIARDYTRRFRQESVMVVKIKVDGVEFISHHQWSEKK